MDVRFVPPAEFKAFLTAQNANGTPITVVYQLAAPTVTELTCTPVSSSTAKRLKAQWADYAPSPEVPVTLESVEGAARLAVVGKNLWDDRHIYW